MEGGVFACIRVIGGSALRGMISAMDSLTLGNLRLDSPVLLAPMAGYTDLPFRLCVRELGGLGLAFTEMLNPASLLHAKRSRTRDNLLATSPDDRPLGYQIYGLDPEIMARGAKWLVERGAPLIDINMGCPQRKISGRGAGAGLLRTPEKAVEIARRVVEAAGVPVTVKLRLGWENSENAAALARELEQAGVAAVTVHGRTREQGFSGKSDLDGIRRVSESVQTVPVIANGDVISVETAHEVLERTGCAGLMLGRQALKEPWVIRDIARDLGGQPPLPPPGPRERLDFMLKHFERMARLYGEEDAVFLFRKWTPQYLKGRAVPRPTLAAIQKIEDAGELRERLAEVMTGS